MFVFIIVIGISVYGICLYRYHHSHNSCRRK